MTQTEVNKAVHDAIVALRRAGFRVWRRQTQHMVNGRSMTCKDILELARSYGKPGPARAGSA